jgi:hypothetical protein
VVLEPGVFVLSRTTAFPADGAAHIASPSINGVFDSLALSLAFSDVH